MNIRAVLAFVKRSAGWSAVLAVGLVVCASVPVGATDLAPAAGHGPFVLAAVAQATPLPPDVGQYEGMSPLPDSGAANLDSAPEVKEAGDAAATEGVEAGGTGIAALPPDQGPGGPILVITAAGNPFTRYYAEILRTEGLNAFATVDISSVTAEMLAGYDIVLLGQMPLNSLQATMLTDYVNAGGKLIAMRPDSRLAPLLGLSAQGATRANAYLLVDASTAPGAGITSQTLQYHGVADLYTINGARQVARLYADAGTSTSNPAVTLRQVGAKGGQAAAFTYDLARYVIYTRQGNPAWASQNRDGALPIRANDLFYGNANSDPQPNWVDLDKVAVPQADEQQRLLANLILSMTVDRRPLPRFWYFPRGLKAVIVLTGDAHCNDVIGGRLERYKALSPAGCSVQDWQCVRSSAYLYPGCSALTNAEAIALTADGFEIGVHIDTGCSDYTYATLSSYFSSQFGQFRTKFPDVARPTSQRTHCVVWSDWASTPKVELANDVRLDTTYYAWPPEWVASRPGMLTGSGLPMRFGDTDGTMIDVYQAATQMTDESGQTYPSTVETLLDRALGPEGYYGAFVANMHHSLVTNPIIHPGAESIIAAAQARGVPVVTARQLFTWWDGRSNSTFSSITWNNPTLSFDITAAAGARGLFAMLPSQRATGTLTELTLNGANLGFDVEVIKGISYAVFPALTGAYRATYAPSIAPPDITAVAAVADLNGAAVITWGTNRATDSTVVYGIDSSSLSSTAYDGTLVTNHVVTLYGLTPGTGYYYRVLSVDANGSSAVLPSAGNPPLTFVTPAGIPTATRTATTTPIVPPTPTATPLPAATATGTRTATPVATTTPSPLPVVASFGSNLLGNNWQWGPLSPLVRGWREGASFVIASEGSNQNGCWSQVLSGAVVRGKTLRYEALMRKTADMGGVAPYISLQVQKPDGGWTYNYGGVINSRAVAGGGYVLDFRDVVIPGDATSVRANFCVWEAAPGTVMATTLQLREVRYSGPVSAPTSTPTPLPAVTATWTPVVMAPTATAVSTPTATPAPIGAVASFGSNLFGANWQWGPLTNLVRGSREGASFVIASQGSNQNGCWSQLLSGAAVRGKTLRYEALMSKTADMGSVAPYISLQVQKPDGGWTYNYGGVINSRAVAGGGYVLDFRDVVIPGDATSVRANFCVWEAAPGTVMATTLQLREVRYSGPVSAPTSTPTPLPAVTATWTPVVMAPTATAVPPATATPTPIGAVASFGSNLLGANWQWGPLTNLVRGSREGAALVIASQGSNQNGCWSQLLSGAAVRGKTLRYEALMSKTADMGSVAPYISLQVQQPGGGWTYNYGGLVSSRAVAGGGYVPDFRDIVIPGDATAVRASFCVWEAALGTVMATTLQLREVRYSGQVSTPTPTVAPTMRVTPSMSTPTPTFTPSGVVSFGSNLLGANWQWGPLTNLVRGWREGAAFVIASQGSNQNGCWSQLLSGAAVRGKTLRYEALMSKTADMGSVAPYISLQVQQPGGGWTYNYGGLVSSRAVAGGGYVPDFRDIVIPGDATAVRASFCVWEAAPGTVSGMDFKLRPVYR